MYKSIIYFYNQKCTKDSFLLENIFNKKNGRRKYLLPFYEKTILNNPFTALYSNIFVYILASD